MVRAPKEYPHRCDTSSQFATDEDVLQALALLSQAAEQAQRELQSPDEPQA